MAIAWVVGSRGFLGSALHRALCGVETNLFIPIEYFCWDCETDLFIQLEKTVKEFAATVDHEKSWQIYWAAGVGTMNSSEEELLTESRALAKLLSLVDSEPRLTAKNGCIVFASSAGAIYAGSTDEIITESSVIAPTTVYAREKLKQENLVRTFARTNQKLTALLARISTLYGPGQATGKKQGLIALIARHIIRKQSIHIYVPLDTIRDYILVDDAATALVATLEAINGTPGVFIKIIASEKPTTIAEIISIYKRISRRNLNVVTSTSKLSSIYSRRIQLHSITCPISEQISRTSLTIGIAQVMAAERLVFMRSQ